jgi:hypothetical protein
MALLVYGLLIVSMAMMAIFVGDAVLDIVLQQPHSAPDRWTIAHGCVAFASGTFGAVLLRVITAVPGFEQLRYTVTPRSVGPYVIANIIFATLVVPGIWTTLGSYAAYLGMVAFWGKITAEFIWWINRNDQ